MARGPLVGLLCLAASWLLVAGGLPRGGGALAGIDRVWLDFRDAFGVVWALCIEQRVNASAAMYGWPVVLNWTGFCQRLGEAAHDVPADVEENLAPCCGDSFRRSGSIERLKRAQRGGPNEP